MKKLDINYDRTEQNTCDTAEILMCIQAWHEMINPGHHHISLHADGSGSVVYALNCPEARDLPLIDCKREIIGFSSLKDFISKTRARLKKEGFEIIDTGKAESLENYPLWPL